MVSYYHILYAPDFGEVFIVKNQMLIMWKVKWGLGVWGVVQLRPIYFAKFKRKNKLVCWFHCKLDALQTLQILLPY